MRVKTAQRMLWLSLFSLVWLGGLGYRLYDLQIVQAADLTRQVFAQRTQSLPLQMRRGRVLDRTGVPLTDPESGYGLGIFPRLLPEEGQTAARLAEVLSVQQVAQVMEHARKSHEPAWVLEGLSRGATDAIQALQIPGVAVGQTGQRYGASSLARHLVGYANQVGGQTGLERAYDEALQGANVPHLVATYDGRGRPLYPEAVRVVKPADPGGKEPYDLRTTIDSRIQKLVELEMDRTGHPLGGPLRAGVVVLDVKSGEPLAIASRPNYVQTSLPTEPQLRNRALTPYETGSVFKSLVAALALDEGLATMDEEFNCTGAYEIGGSRFQDVGGTAHGQIDLAEAIAESCNITFIQLGYERLGEERLMEAARRFGLGSPTGVFPPGEEPAGRLPELRYGGDVAQFSFGQAGLMATPLQIARAYAAIANGGVLNPVRLVTAITKPSGEVVARPPAEAPRRIMSKETAQQLQAALVGVTHPEGTGTGRAAWIDGVGSAGKSGSAETVVDGKPITHAWFAGWFPVRQPQYVIVVLIEDGKAGGTYAAPLFQRIAQGILGL